MKKYIIPVLAVILLAGCQKTVKDKGDDIDTSGYTMFGVDIEALDLGAGTRFDGVWAEGSRIGVFGNKSGDNAEFNLRRSDAGLSAASFYGELVKGDAISAYAPFEQGISLENGAIPFNLAPVQRYDAAASIDTLFAGYCTRLFASLGDDGKLHFRYPMGLLKVVFNFDEPITVTAMQLSSSTGISGRMGVLPSGEILTGAVTRRDITLSIAAPVSSADAEGHPVPFWFVIPPAAYEDGALILEATTAEEVIRVQLRGIEVKRVEGKEFSVASVEVNASLPGFETTPGILE